MYSSIQQIFIKLLLHVSTVCRHWGPGSEQKWPSPCPHRACTSDFLEKLKGLTWHAGARDDRDDEWQALSESLPRSSTIFQAKLNAFLGAPRTSGAYLSCLRQLVFQQVGIPALPLTSWKLGPVNSTLLSLIIVVTPYWALTVCQAFFKGFYIYHVSSSHQPEQGRFH